MGLRCNEDTQDRKKKGFNVVVISGNFKRMLNYIKPGLPLI